jgi:SAM-dependent methyltransferase
MGRRLVPEARFFEADAAELPFPDASFDYITCIGALERMPERERALAEQLRVATPDARFCFLVRGADTFTWRLAMEGLGRRNRRGHQDAASLAVWTERFEHAGFHIEAVLPDQWPLMWDERLLHWMGVETAFTRIRKGFLPLRFANEFIFVLSRG